MAKTSQINRNKKREKLVAQYAAKRARAEGDAEDMKLPAEERFAARLKLAKLPRNSSQGAHPSPLRAVGPAQGYYRKVQAVAHRAARSREFRPDPRHDQGELVRRTTMAITDPIGDLLTRIRNGQLRGKAKVTSPSFAAARAPARRAAGGRLHPRLCRSGVQERPRGARDRAQISRRRAGDPRIEARLDAGPPRLFLGRGTQAASPGSGRRRSSPRRRA